jgi:hypothetical protein
MAACCSARNLLPATHNIKYDADFAEHQSLGFVQLAQSAWNASWNEPQHMGGHQRHRTRTESPGKMAEDVRDHELYRSPEAGAQVRILPGGTTR